MCYVPYMTTGKVWFKVLWFQMQLRLNNQRIEKNQFYNMDAIKIMDRTANFINNTTQAIGGTDLWKLFRVINPIWENVLGHFPVTGTILAPLSPWLGPVLLGHEWKDLCFPAIFEASQAADLEQCQGWVWRICAELRGNSDLWAGVETSQSTTITY